MENKNSKSRKTEITNKGARTYISYATKAAAHPVRSTILKALQESEKATAELESLTSESRYNLYYHLNELEKAGLIEWRMRDNKTKIYHLKAVTRPKVAVILLGKEEIRSKQKEFDSLVDAISKAGGQEIPSRKDIVKAEICLYYNESEQQ
jgi:DNA-binding transcriptional ArsR family regulator